MMHSHGATTPPPSQLGPGAGPDIQWWTPVCASFGATGFMHNRVRMLAESFLVKHLLMDWRLGEAWFWDTLLDGDQANNAAGWQWVAGSGADAAPYFRISSPMGQGEKFDADGRYLRRWVPELARLPDGISIAHAPRIP